jgi:hypothetical protein
MDALLWLLLQTVFIKVVELLAEKVILKAWPRKRRRTKKRR